MELLRQNPEWLLVGGMILITTFLFSRIARRKRNATPSVLTPHEQLERLRQARGMRGDLEELMVEIEQMAKRMGAHLDAKSVRLEHLLAQADQRIAQLQTLQKQQADKPAAGDVAEASTSSAALVAEQAGRSQAASHEQPASAAAPAAVEQLPEDPLARKVYALADSGQSAPQIARHLQEHVGKIELILALRHA